MSNYSVIKYCSVYESTSRVTLTEESGRCIVFEKNSCKIKILDSPTNDSHSKFLYNCYGVLGTIGFLDRSYLVLITDAVKCGRLLLEHDVYSIRSQKLIPLFHPVSLSSAERDFVRVFKDFDISNHFYFSYTYNLSNSLQLNLSYNLQVSSVGVEGGENGWMIFDPVIMDQKYCYNYSHKMDLCKMNKHCFNLSLTLIHGYFSESVLNVCGRNMTLSLISRRSRFFSGTRYRKRGIIGSGYVANDVETEQIMHDWGLTRSVSSFVLMRGSIPIFWSQDPNESFLIKPPIIYPHNDATNSSARAHFKQLLSCYGAPIVVLNLLSDNPCTEEGNLSERYRNVVDELNSELPTYMRIRYYSKNIKSLLEKGVAKQMLKEVVDTVLENIKLIYIPKYKSGLDNLSGIYGNKSIGRNTVNKDYILQNGIIRVSCLDCLDRTSAFSKHLSLRIFKYQLELIGINVNYEQSTCLITNYTPKQVKFSISRDDSIGSDNALELTSFRSSFHENTSYREEAIIASDYFGFNQVTGLLFELIKDRYEEMCDVLSMQYAGSKALKKYEGKSRVINVSRELFTTVKRRYRNFFEDTKIQEQTNFFLYYDVLSYYSQLGINIIKIDLDDLIHFKPIQIQFNNADSFIIALIVYNRRIQKLKHRLGGGCLESHLDYTDGSTGLLEQLDCLLEGPGKFDVLDKTSVFSNELNINASGLRGVSDGDNVPCLETTSSDFSYSAHSRYLGMAFDTDCDTSNSKVHSDTVPGAISDTPSSNIIGSINDDTISNTLPNTTDFAPSSTINSGIPECCRIRDEIEFKKRRLRMILRNYLTVQSQPEDDYTDLSLYKPPDKIINLINTESKSNYTTEFSSRSSIINYNISTESKREFDSGTAYTSTISVKDTRNDYLDFLMPTYTYNKDHWSLEPKCNTQSLHQFINVQI